MHRLLDPIAFLRWASNPKIVRNFAG